MEKVSETAVMTKHGGGTSAYFGKLRGRGTPISSGGEAYLLGRIRFLQEQNQMIIQGDASKSARDFEIKLPGEAITLL